jgi:hypothetical protein
MPYPTPEGESRSAIPYSPNATMNDASFIPYLEKANPKFYDARSYKILLKAN